MAYRLTNFDRDQILNEACAFAFDKRQKELKANESKLAHELFNEVTPEAERKLAAKLPEHWFRLDNCLRFNVAGMDIRLECQPVRVPNRQKGRDDNSYSGSCNRLGVIPEGPLAEKVRQHLASKDDAKKLKDETRARLQALLNSVATVKKLQEVWPEGERFYKRFFDDKPKYDLPALQIGELNAALGLSA